MANRNNSVIVIDIGSKLTLLNVELKGRKKLAPLSPLTCRKRKTKKLS